MIVKEVRAMGSSRVPATRPRRPSAGYLKSRSAALMMRCSTASAAANESSLMYVQASNKSRPARADHSSRFLERAGNHRLPASDVFQKALMREDPAGVQISQALCHFSLKPLLVIKACF
jgi:hypothetical protein